MKNLIRKIILQKVIKLLEKENLEVLLSLKIVQNIQGETNQI